MRDETAITTGCTQRAYPYLERDHDPAGPLYSSSDLDQMTFNPDEVTALIWLTPTKAWRRGDPSARAGGPPRRFSGWQYELPEASTFDTEEIVAALLDAIEPYAAAPVVGATRHPPGAGPKPPGPSAPDDHQHPGVNHHDDALTRMSGCRCTGRRAYRQRFPLAAR